MLAISCQMVYVHIVLLVTHKNPSQTKRKGYPRILFRAIG